MAFHDDLLDQASLLAGLDRSRPKQASLRRAVSTEYYSLFHLLVFEAARNWKQADQRPLLSRFFDHGRMKTACEQETAELNRSLRSLAAAEQALARDVIRIADTFVDMQQHRHAADYDGSRKWSRTETLDKISSVRDAFEIWTGIRSSSTAQGLLVKLLGKRR